MRIEQNHYNAQVNGVMLKMARYIPFVMLGYGAAVHFGLVKGSDLYSLPALVSLITVFVIAGITQDDGYDQSKVQQAIYYLLFLSFSVFVAGMSSVIVYWAPLSMSTVLNFGLRSYWWSSVLLLLFALLDSALHYPIGGFGYLGSNLVLVALVTVASYIAVAITQALMLDHEHLMSAKRRETLQYDRMQALINSLSDAIISVNSKGKIQLYNASALNLLDTNKSIKDRLLDDVFHTRDEHDKKISLFNIISESKRFTMNDSLYHVYSNDERVRIGITAAPIHATFKRSHSRDEGYIFIVRDITKTKSLEDEKDEFISVVSHELRTPIAIAEATLSNLRLLGQKTNFDESAIHSIDEAHEQILYLASMVNDLSTLSRAEQTSVISNELIEVPQFIQEIYQRYRKSALDAQLIIDLDIRPGVDTVTTNRLYLEEILQNFITNAIKYTKGGSVAIKVEKTPYGTRFSVKDSGIGISRSDREKVFDKFYRAEDYRTRETNGTGLGLYVAQKLAHKLQTKIELTSRLNHGSTFSITIK